MQDFPQPSAQTRSAQTLRLLPARSASTATSESKLTQLAQHDSAKLGYVQRRRAQCDQRLRARLYELLASGPGYPQREHDKCATGLLKLRKCTPLPLKDRKERVAGWNGGLYTLANGPTIQSRLNLGVVRCSESLCFFSFFQLVARTRLLLQRLRPLQLRSLLLLQLQLRDSRRI